MRYKDKAERFKEYIEFGEKLLEVGETLEEKKAVEAILAVLRSEKEYYLVKGQKIFISGGQHQGVDNFVHLTLARIEGAPAGV